MITWTLQELSDQVERELAIRHISSPGGRVSAVPNARTIRYYTTLGLVDKPLDYQSGVARYGARHLLQLLAIKTLQGDFLPLPEIQRRLLGRSDAELSAMVGAAPPPEADAPPSSRSAPAASWTAYPIAPGLTLLVQDQDAFTRWSAMHSPEEVQRRLSDATRAAMEHLP